MTWGIIATWRMAKKGVEEATLLLKKGASSADAAELAVKYVENEKEYTSVGYGGLPNQNCEVELDAAFMDGDTLSIGAVAGMKDFENPVSVARELSKDYFNIFLVGEGAESYAHQHGFKRKNMLTKEAREAWERRNEKVKSGELSPYAGHDTVGVVALDTSGKISVAVSTSGLFMKKPGRVGDSPISGSGFYADSDIGGASATGLGEDIMKGCVSYEITRLIKEGLHPQDAAERVVLDFNEKLIQKRGKAGDISVVAMNPKGEWGAATNIEEFPFVVCTEKQDKPTVYIASYKDSKMIVKPLED